MAEADFSWFKTASFVGALVLVVLAFAMIAGGIYLLGDHSFNGVACIVGGMLAGGGAVYVYKNYQKKSEEKRYGKK